MTTPTSDSPAPGAASILSGLVRDRGIGLLSDRRRILGLLRDKAPEETRAIRILMTAFDQGIPARLKGRVISEIDIGREVSTLTAETGIGTDFARDAVIAWADAVATHEPKPILSDPVPPPVVPISVEPLPAAHLPVSPLPPPEAPVEIQPLPVAALPPAAPVDGARPSV